MVWNVARYLHDSPQQLDADLWRTGCWYTDEQERDWRIVVDWRPIGGRLEPVRTEVTSSSDDAPVRPEALRRMPLATVFAEMLSEAHDTFRRLSTPRWSGERPEWVPREDDYARAADTFGVQRGRRLPEALLVRVAEVYRAAYRQGRPVTAAVAEATGCSTSMASKRIMKARAAGLLEGIGPKR
jgi:hypothetical protein